METTRNSYEEDSKIIATVAPIVSAVGGTIAGIATSIQTQGVDLPNMVAYSGVGYIAGAFVGLGISLTPTTFSRVLGKIIDYIV